MPLSEEIDQLRRNARRVWSVVGGKTSHWVETEPAVAEPEHNLVLPGCMWSTPSQMWYPLQPGPNSSKFDRTRLTLCQTRLKLGRSETNFGRPGPNLLKPSWHVLEAAAMFVETGPEFRRSPPSLARVVANAGPRSGVRQSSGSSAGQLSLCRMPMAGVVHGRPEVGPARMSPENGR